jgi:hypothetical protein
MPQTIAPRDALVMAAELAGNAEALIAQALLGFDQSEPEGADALVAQALADLNASVRQVRAFKAARTAGETPEVPTVHQTNGGMIRALADLYTLYGVASPEGFNRRLSSETDYDVRVVPIEEGERAGLRIVGQPPTNEGPVTRELFFPFTRVAWGREMASVEVSCDQALARSAEAPEPPAEGVQAEEAPADAA